MELMCLLGRCAKRSFSFRRIKLATWMKRREFGGQIFWKRNGASLKGCPKYVAWRPGRTIAAGRCIPESCDVLTAKKKLLQWRKLWQKQLKKAKHKNTGLKRKMLKSAKKPIFLAIWRHSICAVPVLWGRTDQLQQCHSMFVTTFGWNGISMWATKKPSYFPTYSLVNRDPYNGHYNPYITIGSKIPFENNHGALFSWLMWAAKLALTAADLTIRWFPSAQPSGDQLSSPSGVLEPRLAFVEFRRTYCSWKKSG